MHTTHFLINSNINTRPVHTCFVYSYKKWLLIASVLTSAAFSTSSYSTPLYASDDAKLSLYGKLKVLLQYDKQSQKKSSSNPPTPWQFKDNASRIGIKGQYKLSDLTVYGRLEVGTNITKEQTPLIYTRKAFVGIKGDFGKLQFGQQNALVKNFNDFDRSHRIGAAVHITRDELNTKRPENTAEYQYEWQDLTIKGQFNLPRDLQRNASFRVGSQRIKLDATRMQGGFGMSAHYTPLKAIDLQLAHQTAHYDLGGEYQVNIASVEWRLSKQFIASSYLAHHQINDDMQFGTSINMAVGGRYKWHAKHRLYASVEFAGGADDLEAGKELTFVMGNDFAVSNDIRAFAEFRQRTFDSQKDSDFRAAVGISYRF